METKKRTQYTKVSLREEYNKLTFIFEEAQRCVLNLKNARINSIMEKSTTGPIEKEAMMMLIVAEQIIAQANSTLKEYESKL